MQKKELKQVLEKALHTSLSGDPEGKDLPRVIEELKGRLPELKFLLDHAFFITEKGIMEHAPLDDSMAWLSSFVDKVVRAQYSLQQPEVDAYFGHACRDKLLETLPATRKTLDICVYTITDNDVANAILKAKNTRVKVRLITDLEKVDALGSDIRYLEKNGIFVKVNDGDAFMHHKFAIFDKRSLITGSYNWTKGAANRNSENFIYTNSPQAVAAFQGEFDSLWESCSWLE